MIILHFYYYMLYSQIYNFQYFDQNYELIHHQNNYMINLMIKMLYFVLLLVFWNEINYVINLNQLNFDLYLYYMVKYRIFHYRIDVMIINLVN